MRKILICLFLITSTAGCSFDDANETRVGLRIENTSNVSFENIFVSNPGGQQMFENLNPGQTSMYKEFGYVYSYGFVSVEINGEEYKIMPFDYVGEEKYESGLYTYQLNFDGTNLTLQFVED